MIAIIAIILFIAAAALVAIRIQKRDSKQGIDEETEFLRLRSQNAVTHDSAPKAPSPKPISIECRANGYRFSVSEDRELVSFIYEQGKPPLSVPASFVTGCEFIRDGNASGHIGRAVVGGIIAGGAGAIVGASTGAGVPQRYSLIVYLNDLNNPSVEYSLLDRTTPHSKAYYETVARFAESVSATIRVLVSQNQN